MVDDERAESTRGFYLRLLRRAPVLLWQAGDRIVTAVGLILALFAGLNQTWSAWFVKGSAGIAPSWGFVPVAALFLYGLLKANHEEFAAVEGREQAALEKFAVAQRQLEEESSREALIGRLGGFLRELDLLSDEMPPHATDILWPTITATYNDINLRVMRDLRLHAQGFLVYLA